jgi:hypothetical protein
LFLLLTSTSRKGDISGARSWEASSAASSSSTSLAKQKVCSYLFIFGLT